MNAAAVTDLLSACDDVAAAVAFEVDLGAGSEVVGAVELATYISGPMLRNLVEEQLPKASATDSVVSFAGVLVVDQIPSSGDGSADLNALRRLAVEHAAKYRYIEPQGALQQQLATVWEQVLGCPRVGAEDDFLELGGDSFSAITLIGEVEQQYNIELDIFELMESATVRGLATLLAERGVVPADGGARELNA